MREALAGTVFAAGLACSHPKQEPPIQSMTVEITGHDYKWIVRYPGEDGKLETPDDVFGRQDLHVPVGVETTVLLKSRDYVYTFALPDMNCREIAVPDLEFTLRFKPDAAGTYELVGDNMCGSTHPDLLGKLVVQTAPEFRAWLREKR